MILPGGMPGSKNLNEHKGLKAQILEYQKNEKYLAAICAAPIVFGNLGILNEKNVVCYPGYEPQLVGAKIQTVPCIIDENIITGRGVGAALKFSLEIVRILSGEVLAEQLRKAMLVD